VNRGKAALLRHFASSAAVNPIAPDRTVFEGLEDACEDIERMVRAVKDTLDVGTLDTELKPSRMR
jgi:hypothetical protein